MKKATLGMNGRIVIPKLFRREMNIEEGASLMITFEDGAVVIRPDKSICGLCGAPMESERKLRLCDKCIQEVLKYHKPNETINAQ